MADETNEKDGGAKRRLLPLAIAAVAALLVGGLSGAFVAGPLLAPRVSPAAASTQEKAKRAADLDESGEEEAPGAQPRPVYTVENLVLNPAGSGGTRFLMVTVALELKDETVAGEVKQRDAELRDVLLRVLGARTVDQLADIGARDAIKQELRDSTAAVFRRGSVRTIYLPQFVIQ